MGSASELEYQLLLSRDLGLMKPHIHSKLEDGATEVKRMLSALISTLRRKN
jgi:four helix bundle protein